MPTITIDTPALRPAERRAVAVRLTRWLVRRGVQAAHVVVRFVDTPEGSVFSGGMPLEALPAGTSPIRHASVICCVGPDRDEEFQAALAAEIGEALGANEDTPFLYVEFRPTRPSHVYLLRQGRWCRADEAAVPNEGETPR